MSDFYNPYENLRYVSDVRFFCSNTIFEMALEKDRYIESVIPPSFTGDVFNIAFRAFSPVNNLYSSTAEIRFDVFKGAFSLNLHYDRYDPVHRYDIEHPDLDPSMPNKFVIGGPQGAKPPQRLFSFVYEDDPSLNRIKMTLDRRIDLSERPSDLGISVDLHKFLRKKYPLNNDLYAVFHYWDAHINVDTGLHLVYLKKGGKFVPNDLISSEKIIVPEMEDMFFRDLLLRSGAASTSARVVTHKSGDTVLNETIQSEITGWMKPLKN